MALFLDLEEDSRFVKILFLLHFCRISGYRWFIDQVRCPCNHPTKMLIRSGFLILISVFSQDQLREASYTFSKHKRGLGSRPVSP